ncbi:MULTISPECIES: MFS transporter [unclassified Herbaspirillum]|uniref:MFS transporter n=1 Tax=unclassified Herbaspirillum TaxID=2624150 RepID=UPI00114F96A5|nr:MULTISPECIES: MFS transporter [unclassified Herbaspirillum]MBB5390440.1 MFS family permease [Herbaspirillum sp. SJZ102]TQK09065.1 putative MFS family arabinose efflux permease [Herbaspirillum sp. SJZ130]TQK14248.1 putative MFS family arabinose efflux permease [Herbaspirillum sp. SJZ106]
MNNPLRELPSFRYFFLCRIATTMANQMLMVIVAWQMYDITHSAYDLGLVGLAQFIPALALCLVVGQAADRYDRRIILMASFGGQCAVALVLIAGTNGGWLGRDVILAASIALGVAKAFQMPTQQALLPTLVPLAALPRALAVNSAGSQFATIAGPAIGGFLYVAGPQTVYGICAALLLAGAAALRLIRYERALPPREPATLRGLFSGISFIWKRKEVLGAISLDLFAVLFGGATALLPIFARDVLHTGSWGLGLLRSAPAIGALFMSLYLARHPIRRRVGKIMFGSVALYGMATIVFALSDSFLLSLAALTLTGAFDMISVVVRQSLVQLDTPDDMRGRVSAVNSIFIGASNQLGEFESGLTAGWFGTVPSVLLGGAGTLLIVACWVRIFPTLARREKLA